MSKSIDFTKEETLFNEILNLIRKTSWTNGNEIDREEFLPSGEA